MSEPNQQWQPPPYPPPNPQRRGMSTTTILILVGAGIVLAVCAGACGLGLFISSSGPSTPVANTNTSTATGTTTPSAESSADPALLLKGAQRDLERNDFAGARDLANRIKPSDKEYPSAQKLLHDIDSTEKTAAPTIAPASSKWVVETTKSPMDDSNGLTCSLGAENEIEGWLAKKKPILIFRCKEHKIEAYVITGMASSVDLYGHQVRIRIDDGPPLKERWSDSTDNESLFAPRAGELVKRLTKAKTMLFEFVPFNASPATIVFDVRGFEQLTRDLARVCAGHSKAGKGK